jgi:hypothetical protein
VGVGAIPRRNMNAPCGCRWSYTRLLFALATAYRLLCAHEATGGEPVGWQRWRCQLFEQTRDLVIVDPQGYDGIFHMAEDLLQVGVSIKEGTVRRHR